jgi:hypothetical protein
MTMWRHSDPVEGMSRSFPVLICRTNAGDHAALGVTGLPTKPSSDISKMFDPTARSSVPSSPVLILDPCSSLPSFIDWRACCGDFAGPVRSKLGCLRCRGDSIRTPAAPLPRTRPTGDAANSRSSQWSQDSLWLERPRRSCGQQRRTAVEVHAPATCTMVEVQRHRPIFPASFQT